MARQRLELDAGLKVNTAPKSRFAAISLDIARRPRLGCLVRPDVGAYIRELAIFSTNMVELIPPRSDDAADSRTSRSADRNDVECRASPASTAGRLGLVSGMGQRLFGSEDVEFALKEWGDVFKRLPRIDQIFVPGGDPGHTQPKYMMALLEKQTENLHRYHPKAQMWMSPQGFTKEWMDEYFAIMKTEPKWLSGVVYGPQQMYSLVELRERLPAGIPSRFYPDITHSIHSQYPWISGMPHSRSPKDAKPSPAARSPRPPSSASIFRTRLGSFRNSEGCNDDVNKFLWSGLAGIPMPTLIRFSASTAASS